MRKLKRFIYRQYYWLVIFDALILFASMVALYRGSIVQTHVLVVGLIAAGGLVFHWADRALWYDKAKTLYSHALLTIHSLENQVRILEERTERPDWRDGF